MSLSNPEKKMSKSDENKNSYISILDSEEEIVNKFKKAVTDSDDRIIFSEEKKGISNLLNIYCAFSKSSKEETENIFKNKTYKDLKLSVSDIVIKNLKPIQEKYNNLIKNKDILENICKEGAEKARAIAKKTIEIVFKKVGLK